MIECNRLARALARTAPGYMRACVLPCASVWASVWVILVLRQPLSTLRIVSASHLSLLAPDAVLQQQGWCWCLGLSS